MAVERMAARRGETTQKYAFGRPPPRAPRDTPRMRGSKLEVVLGVVAAFNARDLDAILDLSDPEAELDTRGAARSAVGRSCG